VLSAALIPQVCAPPALTAMKVPAGGVDVYVFAGPTAMDAIRRYNLYCGGGALPPKWGLGFLTRTPTAYTAEQALAEVAQFRQQGIPLDMIGLEPGWQDRAYPCSFEWDQTRFPDPAGFLAQLEKLHVRANLWFNPYVSPTAPLYAKLLPFAGSHLVWNGIVPDYTLPAARKIFSDHLQQKIVDLDPAAVGGFKIDEVDGGDGYLWADVATFPSGRDAEQLRQTYGVLLQKTIFDLYHRENRRTLGQVRGTNAGASALPFVIYNDNYDFNEYITAVGNTAFAGVLWSPEVRSGEAEDMVRRTQAVCFSPLALFNGWMTATKLWTHPTATGPIRDAIMLRQRLLPYWYTTFAQYHYEGTPVIRPLPLLPGFGAKNSPEAGKLDATTNPYALGRVAEVTDEYMVGDALLVAPIAPAAKTREVVLPAGKWFDFYTGKFAGENQTIERNGSALGDRLEEILDRLGAPAGFGGQTVDTLCLAPLPREDVGGRAHAPLLEQGLDALGPEPLDIEGVAGNEVAQAFHRLSRAGEAAGAAAYDLPLLARRDGTAFRTGEGEFEGGGAVGTIGVDHPDDLRDDVARAAHDDHVAGTNVLPGDLVLIM